MHHTIYCQPGKWSKSKIQSMVPTECVCVHAIANSRTHKLNDCTSETTVPTPDRPVHSFPMLHQPVVCWPCNLCLPKMILLSPSLLSFLPSLPPLFLPHSSATKHSADSLESYPRTEACLDIFHYKTRKVPENRAELVALCTLYRGKKDEAINCAWDRLCGLCFSMA